MENNQDNNKLFQKKKIQKKEKHQKGPNFDEAFCARGFLIYIFVFIFPYFLFIYLFIHFSSLSIIFISISITLLLYCTVKIAIFPFLSTETMKLLHNDAPKLYHFEINTQLSTVKRRLEQGSFLYGLLLCFYSLNKVVVCFVLTEKREKIKNEKRINSTLLLNLHQQLLGFPGFFQIFFCNLKLYHLHFNSST